MRECAVFTIVKNEDFFLPIWLKHYSRFFSNQDIYILDHDSEGASATLIQQIIDMRIAHVMPVHWDYLFNHEWLRRTVNRFQNFLLQSYRKVIFAEVDELLTTRHGSNYADLRDYVDRFDGELACTTGYSVIHFPAIGEKTIDLNKPLLHQMKYWHQPTGHCETGKFVHWYNKPLLASVPVEYAIGFHYTHSHSDVAPDPDFILVHLHEMDMDVIYDRSNKKDRSRFDPAIGDNFHNNPLSYDHLNMLRMRLPQENVILIPEDQKDII